MTVTNGSVSGKGGVALTKGAPEAVLPLAIGYRTEDGRTLELDVDGA